MEHHSRSRHLSQIKIGSLNRQFVVVSLQFRIVILLGMSLIQLKTVHHWFCCCWRIEGGVHRFRRLNGRLRNETQGSISEFLKWVFDVSDEVGGVWQKWSGQYTWNSAKGLGLGLTPCTGCMTYRYLARVPLQEEEGQCCWKSNRQPQKRHCHSKAENIEHRVDQRRPCTNWGPCYSEAIPPIGAASKKWSSSSRQCSAHFTMIFKKDSLPRMIEIHWHGSVIHLSVPVVQQ